MLHDQRETLDQCVRLSAERRHPLPSSVRFQSVGSATSGSAAAPGRPDVLIQAGTRLVLAAQRQSSETALETDARQTAWNVGARNRYFSGREELLQQIANTLSNTHRGVIQALHGFGGIGKTQLALEYAHRETQRYDVVWWMNAERVELIDNQFHALSLVLNITPPEANQQVALARLRTWFHQKSRWLVIFDNAENPDDIVSRVPNGLGHVLITSRNPRWDEVAQPVLLDVLDRHESVQLLGKHWPSIPPSSSQPLAEALGDLPLALVQAARFLKNSGLSVTEYIQMLEDQAERILNYGRSSIYPRTLAASLKISCDTLAREDACASTLLRMYAQLAPEVIPFNLAASASNLASASGSQLRSRAPHARATVSLITEWGLAREVMDGLQFHRLTIAFLKDNTPKDEFPAITNLVHEALAAVRPGAPTDPTVWPQWQLLIPHIFKASSYPSASPSFRNLVNTSGFYLVTRGESATAAEWLSPVALEWTLLLGEDHPDVLHIKHVIALTMRKNGDLASARALDEDNLRRRKRVLGDGVESTLSSANNLGNDLLAIGLPNAAYDIHSETYQKRLRNNGGHEDLESLNSAHNMADALRATGRSQESLQLDLYVLDQRIEILGEAHPHTYYSYNNVGKDLLALSRPIEALDYLRPAYEGHRAILGENHSETLDAGSGLARSLFLTGATAEASSLNDEILERQRVVLGENHPSTLRTTSNLL